MLKALIYASDFNTQLSQDELDELVNESANNNQKAAITGFLSHRDKNYLQYIEGKPRKIDKLMAKIRVDNRHSNIREYSYNIKDRKFPKWSMVMLPEEVRKSADHTTLIISLLNLNVPQSMDSKEILNILDKLISNYALT